MGKTEKYGYAQTPFLGMLDRAFSKYEENRNEIIPLMARAKNGDKDAADFLMKNFALKIFTREEIRQYENHLSRMRA